MNLEEYAQQLKALKDLMPKPNAQQACPNCGYCPHCGRGGFYVSPYQPQPYYYQPWQPHWGQTVCMNSSPNIA